MGWHHDTDDVLTPDLIAQVREDLIEDRTETAYRLLRASWVSALELAGVDQDGDAERCVLENTLRALIAEAHEEGRLR